MIGRRMGNRVIALPGQLGRGETALSATAVEVRFGDAAILRGVDISVAAGELVALVGPNGAGKSTLLAALAGDTALAGGDVALAGRTLSEWSIADMARQRAVLTQHNDVTFPFLVRDVVEMGRAPWQRTPREADDDLAVEQAIAQTEIAHLIHRTYPSLSGGERARSSLARVLAQRTGIVMLDEPTAALDIRHQEAVMSVARERADAGDAVIVVLHDLSLAAAYADTVALLQDGMIRAIGTPVEVMTAETISDVYGHPVAVVANPAGPGLLIVPHRVSRPGPDGAQR